MAAENAKIRWKKIIKLLTLVLIYGIRAQEKEHIF